MKNVKLKLLNFILKKYKVNAFLCDGGNVEERELFSIDVNK